MSVIAFATSIANTAYRESTKVGDTSSDRSSTYVKEAIENGNYSGTDQELTSSEDTLYFDSVSGSFWVTDTIYMQDISSGYNVLRIMEGDTSLIRVEGTSGSQFNVYLHDGTEEVLAYTTSSDDVDWTYNTTRLDINYRYGTDGGLDFYVNRTLVNSYDIDTSGATLTPDRARFGKATDSSLRLNTCHSSFIIADEDTTLLTMVQFELESNGSFTDFTNDYSYLSAIGETGDSHSVESSAAGDVSTYKFTDRSSDIDGGTVVGLGLFCRAKTQEAVSADQFRFVAYDGTDTSYSDYAEMDQYITPYQAVLATNPAGDTWTLSDIATHEFGFEVSENG